jgi:7-keto-8-aminopelargonate synthetase-like enzyme
MMILPVDAILLVDDAHGAAVLGATGKGTPEFVRAARHRIIQTTTLSKGFGVYGGVVLCSRALRGEIMTQSPAFVGSTPLPLPLVNAALAALALHRRHPALRTRLYQNTERVKSALAATGVSLTEAPGPIVQIIPSDARQATRLRHALLAALFTRRFCVIRRTAERFVPLRDFQRTHPRAIGPPDCRVVPHLFCPPRPRSAPASAKSEIRPPPTAWSAKP